MSENNEKVVADEVVEPKEETMETSPVNEEVEAVTSVDQLEEALAKVAELENKLQDADNRYLRLQADMDNMRRRNRLETEAQEKYRAQKLVAELLPALDNFERALTIQTDNEQVKTMMQGMEMVYRGIVEALKTEGVSAIETEGKEFDPNYHHAVMQEEVEGIQPNTVILELQKGYVLKDRVIRPAMVKVSQ